MAITDKLLVALQYNSQFWNWHHCIIVETIIYSFLSYYMEEVYGKSSAARKHQISSLGPEHWCPGYWSVNNSQVNVFFFNTRSILTP